ncbi:MAG: LacI family transcriptional regulator [Proteobacteria bacterium]|nr:LacI family transcriptional regulator [Pseudomonadota bacterium]
MPTQRPATLQDVATAAGVSATTVSKFVNGQKRFSLEVETRIRAAIDALDYRQNPVARSMATGKTRVVGLAVLDIRNPHFTNIIQGASQVAEEHGYGLMVVDFKEKTFNAQNLLSTLALRVDGIIASSRLPQEALDELQRIGKPAVLFGQTDPDQPPAPILPSVRIQGYQAAFMLGKHLQESGRKHLVYLAYPQSRWNQERLHGLRDAMPDATIRVMELETQTMEAGERAAATALYGSEKVDAIVCYNDMIAIGLLHEACSLGVQVPEQIAIAGFDNVPVTRYLTPPLTTVDMCSEQQGEKAMELLLHIIKTGQIEPTELQLEPRLIVRASTGVQRKS